MSWCPGLSHDNEQYCVEFNLLTVKKKVIVMFPRFTIFTTDKFLIVIVSFLERILMYFEFDTEVKDFKKCD